MSDQFNVGDLVVWKEKNFLPDGMYKLLMEPNNQRFFTEERTVTKVGVEQHGNIDVISESGEKHKYLRTDLCRIATPKELKTLKLSIS